MFLSQVSVITANSELLFSFSSHIKFSLCLRHLALTADILIVQTISSPFLSTVGTCLRFLISSFPTEFKMLAFFVSSTSWFFI